MNDDNQPADLLVVRASGAMLQADTGSPEDRVLSGFSCRCCVRFNGDVNWPTHTKCILITMQSKFTVVS